MQTKVLLHLLMWRLCFVPTGYIFDLPRSREFCLLWMDWRLGLFACHCIAILQEKQHRSNWFLDVLGISGVTRWIFIATSQDLKVLPHQKKHSFRIWKYLIVNHFRLMKVDPDSPRKRWVFYTHCLVAHGIGSISDISRLNWSISWRSLILRWGQQSKSTLLHV